MDNHKKVPSKKQQEKAEIKKGVEHQKGENFISLYANNVLLETSSWDLKMIFGELEQSGRNANFVVQHTAMTMPWPYVKLLIYLLRLNLFTHEASHGRAIVPKGLVPKVGTEKPPNIPDELFAQARKLYEEFLSENPEAHPDYQPWSEPYSRGQADFLTFGMARMVERLISFCRASAIPQTIFSAY